METARENSGCLVLLIFIILLILKANPSSATVTSEEKKLLRAKSQEMFYHACNAYMNHAYPADELMPLSCKGRYQGTEPSRGDADDALGNFTLTLIDTLDTLAVLGDLEAFEKSVRNVVKDSRFDADITVSVFETNIRIVGGLLGGHVAAVHFRQKNISMQWYQDELLTMTKEVADRLLPAFDTPTGIPYPRVNLKHGITPAIANSNRDTCTSCAGTMILEFAALSRLTGLPVYEEKARRAMNFLWEQRERSNNLMGTVINIHNGDWVRRESGVGAGIDSYYEYVLKTYVLLGDDVYLTRFNKHYDAVMRYISHGPLLVDVLMHKPTSVAKNFMDSLLAFWPGLQVLAGDIGPAVETHEMLYQIVQKHNFLPEAFTSDFRVHWGQHPLRPEFVESTYFLYKATSDPYYLKVGKTVMDNLDLHARVDCGFAAIKDIKAGTHENQMDSFVLAETFKYLYLLFSEKEDVILNIDDFIFTTEAHLLPLTLSVGNYSWISSSKLDPGINEHQKNLVTETASVRADVVGVVVDGAGGVCRNYHITDSQGPGYPDKLRHKLKDFVLRSNSPVQTKVQKLRAADFVAGNNEHIAILQDMGIKVVTIPDGRIQLLQTSSEALSETHAETGLLFMQEMIELSKSQQQISQYMPMFVRVLPNSDHGEAVYTAGPAQFGYDLRNNPSIRGTLAIARPLKACSNIDNSDEVLGKIVIIARGDCIFVQKARNLQQRGAIGGIVIDDSHTPSSQQQGLFVMSGDGINDIAIPVVFLSSSQAQDLLDIFSKYPDSVVELTSKGSISYPGSLQPKAPSTSSSVASGPESASSSSLYCSSSSASTVISPATSDGKMNEKATMESTASPDRASRPSV